MNPRTEHRTSRGANDTPPRSAGAAPLIACGLLLLGSCAHMNFENRAQPSRRFEAKGTPAAEYRTEPDASDGLRGPHASRVGQGIARALAQRNARMLPDGRLGELAERVADALDAQGSPPPYAVIDLWTHHLGLVEPAPHLLVLTQSSAGTLPERVQNEVDQMLAQQHYTHFGAATLERNGTVFAVLALSWRLLDLKPTPRTLAPGATIDLEGELRDGVHDPELIVLFPDGTDQRVEAPPGTRFALHVPTRGRGEHRVELLANSELGDTVVANFPVYVGVPPATEIVIAGEPMTEGGGQLGEAAAKHRFLDLINQDRKRAHLAPLELNDALGKIARAHSVDMQTHGFIGHTSPTTGNAVDRVKRAGIRTSLVLENIGRGYGPDEVHRGLMDSPGHRVNVLSPDATDLGVGLVLTPEDQRTAYVVTELFARFAKKIDVDDASDDLFESINRERARRGLRPLSNDKTMAQLAAQTARQFFEQPTSERQRLVEQVNKTTSTKKLNYTRLGTLMTVVTTPDEAASIDALLDPKARGLGLGLAQGTRPDTIENAIAVVALIGY